MIKTAFWDSASLQLPPRISLLSILLYIVQEEDAIISVVVGLIIPFNFIHLILYKIVNGIKLYIHIVQ